MVLSSAVRMGTRMVAWMVALKAARRDAPKAAWMAYM
jgi:hypothetical protein